jgi:CelD/BcsL family acetyltransferase involved in cellulose biosynthesis
VKQPALEAEIVEDFDSIRDEWRRLALASQNIFATWEWTTLWWRHFGEGRRRFVVACRTAEGTLVAIVPLYLWRAAPVRVLRFLGHGLGDQLGPICAAHDQRGLAGQALDCALEAVAEWDVVLGEQLPAWEGWGERAGVRVLSQEGTPLIRAGGWDEYLSTRSSGARQEIRSDGRRLERRHKVAYRRADDATRLDSDLDTLFALHRRRFGTSTSFAAAERLHREFAACALERGWLRLWLLELEGSPVAARYGFRFGGAECGYQSGWDPGWRSAGVGFILQVHVIRAAFEDGIREYRMLRGNEPYKYRLATADPGLVTVAFARSAIGRVAVASAAFSRPIIRSLRSLPAALKRARGG